MMQNNLAAPDASGVVDSELLFLISHALCNGPLAHIGRQLAQEASEQGLLPARYDVEGDTHTTTL